MLRPSIITVIVTVSLLALLYPNLGLSTTFMTAEQARQHSKDFEKQLTPASKTKMECTIEGCIRDASDRGYYQCSFMYEEGEDNWYQLILKKYEKLGYTYYMDNNRTIHIYWEKLNETTTTNSP